MASEKSSTFSEPGYAKPSEEKERVPWFLANIDKALIPEVGYHIEVSLRYHWDVSLLSIHESDSEDPRDLQQNTPSRCFTPRT